MSNWTNAAGVLVMLIEHGVDTVGRIAFALEADELAVGTMLTEMVDLGWVVRLRDGNGRSHYRVADRRSVT